MAAPEKTATSGTFARKSSGLVKEIRLSDFGMWGLYMALVLFFNLFIFPIYIFELPSASVPLAIVISFIFAIPVYILYGALGSAMPRAGGDYLFQSRGIHPLAGLIVTFGWATLNLNWPAFASTPYISQGTDALGPYFSIVGKEVGNSGLSNLGSYLGSGDGITTLGVVMLAAAFLVYLAGIKWLVRLQRYFLVILLFVSAFAIPAIYLISGSSAISNFNSISAAISGNPDTYHSILNGATANGFVPSAFSWSSTIIMAVLFLLSISAPIFANPMIGEVKGGGHFRNLTLTYAISGLVTAFVFLFPELYLFINGYGQTFVQAAAYAGFIGVKGTTVGVPISYGFFTLAATSNIPLQTLFIFGYTAVAFMLPILGIMMASRYQMGASIDGVLPLWFSTINSRLKRPVNAMILPLIGTIIALYVGSHYVSGLLLLVAIGSVSTLFIEGGSGLSGILFPIRQKFVVKSSPVARYPWIMKISGAIVLAYALLLAYWYVTVPSLQLSLGPIGDSLMIGSLIVCVVVFVTMTYRKKRQGIDIMAAFREVPPE